MVTEREEPRPRRIRDLSKLDPVSGRMYGLILGYYYDGYRFTYDPDKNMLRFYRLDFWESVIQLDIWFTAKYIDDVIDLIYPAL